MRRAAYRLALLGIQGAMDMRFFTEFPEAVTAASEYCRAMKYGGKR